MSRLVIGTAIGCAAAAALMLLYAYIGEFAYFIGIGAVIGMMSVALMNQRGQVNAKQRQAMRRQEWMERNRSRVEQESAEK
ncbi:hypothetical protein WJ0W_000769 [Paenibacillus melissococcoides]|uniref:Uncharacterized protein n=1 Tax=Paenibacillus melissococcoides TaxID=2912268 RepID=A0ABN8U1U7_9BACL|nr:MULTISPECIES: hypothetical protein [Paenibacillus]MEB9893312.1 hypothetical protein [Bacillus cereus]CAH8243529.1 hypothetical protein WJ0W_000769 [Paenibacillus melissococcoides]CAH8704778.1 hypothetical protein WDD9_000755 [Paenibacillus melissococcoides]CAH8708005.1 hypothetical protein HTL2_001841 [Paenibacillus melissococcoides]GIO76418.1 hypothetical protein J6TS7_00280 [Paenibacillus dendritiformis]